MAKPVSIIVNVLGLILDKIYPLDSTPIPRSFDHTMTKKYACPISMLESWSHFHRAYYYYYEKIRYSSNSYY